MSATVPADPVRGGKQTEMRRLHILSVVSGKGGVGKTMLSVALANELARQCKTLLFDLDFFNRGLTGLFASISESAPKITVPAFPLLARTGEAVWSIAEVAKNLYSVCYGDLDKSEADSLEVTDLTTLSRSLSGYIQTLVDACGAEAVVLDCHGGRDNASFAACLLAEHSLLVSEPDRITLHGTLHFLRTLKHAAADGEVDIRLVFNKVIAAFSTPFLFRFYRDYLQAEFGGKPLLGIYPFEVHLTKAFEKTPFLTTVYPTSQLARKTRVVLYDLFVVGGKKILSPAISGMSSATRWRRRYLMGREPRVLNLDFIIRLIALCAITLIGIPLLTDWANTRYVLGLEGSFWLEKPPQAGGAGLAILSVWLVIAVMLNWGRELDVLLTYSFRTRGFLSALAAGIIFVIVWALPIGVVGGVLGGLLQDDALVALPVVMICGYPLLAYARRGIQNIRFDQRYAEGSFRIMFSILAAAGIGAMALISI